jgi:formylglycine-generating enzyme required for sulfatase activity
MQLVPAGAFEQGTPPDDELENFGDRKERRVRLPGYCIDRFEYPGQPKALPMTGLTFAAAKAECEKQGKRLCSEDEWEKACKGPEDQRFPYGRRFDLKACNGGARLSTLAPSGAFPRCQSGYGLFDMSGNAAEWTSSRFQAGSPDRAIKGGAVDRPDTDLRCSARQNRSPLSHSPLLGVRCCAETR